nr:D-alanyl-D-alanine carboxypeptidase [Clostridia bacterium]
MLKKLFIMLIVCIMTVTSVMPLYAYELEIDAQSAILMEAATGTVLYEKDADRALPPASVTQIMTLLLVMEAIDSGTLKYDDMIQVSANAASMGGSQIYLEPGETMCAEDMIKAVVISSANDAAVALAEHIAGSEEGFVAKMNERAAQLGMVNTKFENTNGLDDTTESHLTSARDIAIMSRELIKHEKILEYSSTWMDTVRNGEFGLTNTNRLVRLYNGANGLKTGSTSKAKFCISATAKRDGMQLIAVIMASPTRDIRNEAAKKLLDYGFANYAYVSIPAGEMGEIKVLGGVAESCPLVYDGFDIVVPKGKEDRIEQTVILNENAAAPVAAGSALGLIEYTIDGEKIGETEILAGETVEKISYFGILGKIIKKFLLL